MSALEMLFGECKIIAEEEIPEVMAINDQLIIWVSDAEKELLDLRAENERLKGENNNWENGYNKLAERSMREIDKLVSKNARFQKAVEEAEMAINKIIKRDVFEPMDKEDYDEWLDWLKEYGKG